MFEVRRRGLFSKLRLPTLRQARSKISLRLLLVFNQELAALLRSGLPMLQALGLLLDRQRDPFLEQRG